MLYFSMMAVNASDTVNNVDRLDSRVTKNLKVNTNTKKSVIFGTY